MNRKVFFLFVIATLTGVVFPNNVFADDSATDTDNDGIADGVDKCADTPEGASVVMSPKSPYLGCSATQVAAMCEAPADKPATKPVRKRSAKPAPEPAWKIALQEHHTVHFEDKDKDGYTWRERATARDNAQDAERELLKVRVDADEAYLYDEDDDGYTWRQRNVIHNNEQDADREALRTESREADRALRADIDEIGGHELLIGVSALALTNKLDQGRVGHWQVNQRPILAGTFTFGWQYRMKSVTVRALLSAGPGIDKTGKTLAIAVNGGVGVFGNLGGKGVFSLGGIMLIQGVSYNVAYPQDWGSTSSSPFIGALPMVAADASFGRMSVTLGVGPNMGAARLPGGIPKGTVGVGGMLTVAVRFGLQRKQETEE